MNNILEQLKAISSAVMFAAEARELESVLERIADAARDLIGTKYAALGVPDGQGGLRFFKTSGLTKEQEAKIPHRPVGKGLIGAIMRERTVIRLDNMKQDPRSVGFPENHPHMTSFLGAPIIVGNNLYGMLYLSDKVNGSPFNKDDEVLIETLAGYAALAIAGAQLTENESRLQLLEERERIGMELHDGVIQSLYGIGMQIDLMRRSGGNVTEGHLSRLVDNLNDVIEDIRLFIGNLRHRNNPLTVRQWFEQLIERLHSPQDIHIEINAPDSYAPFSPSAFESICLIANEALSNAIRHSQAEHIWLNIEQKDNLFNIVIMDDGLGFDTKNTQVDDGLGLKNMQHRASIYGGEIHIDSKHNEGTKITITIPIGSH